MINSLLSQVILSFLTDGRPLLIYRISPNIFYKNRCICICKPSSNSVVWCDGTNWLLWCSGVVYSIVMLLTPDRLSSDGRSRNTYIIYINYVGILLSTFSYLWTHPKIICHWRSLVNAHDYMAYVLQLMSDRIFSNFFQDSQDIWWLRHCQ